MFASDLANPGSDSQSNSGLRKIIRKVSLEFANFDWTRQPLSRPLQDCEGCPAFAGVRNLSLDNPSAGCSDLHRNFGVRSIWARRAAAARRAGSSSRVRPGLDRAHRSSGRMAAACGVRGTRWRSCGDGARSWQVSQASGAAALAGSSSSNADATSRQPPAEEPHSSQRSNNATPGSAASPREAVRAGLRTSGRKVPAAPARLCEALQNQ